MDFKTWFEKIVAEDANPAGIRRLEKILREAWGVGVDIGSADTYKQLVKEQIEYGVLAKKFAAIEAENEGLKQLSVIATREKRTYIPPTNRMIWTGAMNDKRPNSPCVDCGKRILVGHRVVDDAQGLHHAKCLEGPIPELP